jgi:histidinol-phosphate phosphatase family protein
MSKKNKAIFLDRDGVINKERSDYVKTVKELEIFSDIWVPVKRLKDAGFLIIIITNQSAINKKLTTHKKVQEIHLEIQKHLNENGTSIDEFYYCPHTPAENCDCRKPKTGMLLEALDDFKIDLKSSWFIGDCDSDMEAAIKVGCKHIKITSEISLSKAVEKIFKEYSN